MENRIVLQMDQTAFEDKKLLGSVSKRCKMSDLDSSNHIFNGGHLEEKTGTKAKYLRNAPLFVHFSF